MALLALSCAPEIPILGGTETCADARTERVACVVDGDTFRVEACEGGESVRLLGVDAPEIAHSDDQESDCYGDASAAWATDLLDGAIVRLDFDETCTDVYDRTLAWVTLEVERDDPLMATLLDLELVELEDDQDSAGVLVNELAIRLGHARLYDEDFAQDVIYYEQLEDAEHQAQLDGRGLWSACK